MARSFRFHDRGNALRDAGQYDRALADYDTAQKLAPTDAWVLIDRGRTYGRMGRPEAAKSDFDSALRLDPSNQDELQRAIDAEAAVLLGQRLPSTVAPSQTPPVAPPPQQPAPVQRVGGTLSSRPTFDCAKAKSPLPLLICAGEEAARADWDLSIASWARYFSLEVNDRATFWDDQDKWLRSLNQSCQLANSTPPFTPQQTSCIVSAYRGRADLYRSKLTGDALAESRLTPEQLSQLQQALIARGSLNGEADGEFGPTTRDAIRNYQQANGFPQSDYLSAEQRRTLLEGFAGRAAIVPSNATGNSITAGTPAASQQTPVGQRADGEFSRLVRIPDDCQTARQFGVSGRWKTQLAFQQPIQAGRPPPDQTPGPACLVAESCFQMLKSQAAAGVEYLTSNPAVSDALSSQLHIANPMRVAVPIVRNLQQLLATQSGPWGPYNHCTLVWTTVNGNWYPLLADRPLAWASYPFLDFSTAGQALLEKVHADYATDEREYQQLLAFNDRYAGFERFDRAHTSYQQAFKNDDVAAMINGLSAMLQGLEQARARKQLLTQQSAQLAQNEQALADLVTSIDREGLTSFVSQQTQTAIGEVRRDLARLNQMAPRVRGDVSAKLDIFATQQRDIDSGIRSARSMKTQAEQTRQMLVESANAGRHVLDAANSEDLRGAFDEEFRNSTSELINRLSELASIDLGAIQQKQEDIGAAKRKLAVLQDQVSNAEARYERAKQLDTMRQATLQNITRALSELVQPEIRGKLGNDGLDIISTLRGYQDALSSFDNVKLISRTDYSDTLAAAEAGLAKTQQFKNELGQVAQLSNDLQQLNKLIDRRGRRLLDGPTSSAIADIAKSASALSYAKIPLSSEARLQLSNTQGTLNRITAVVDSVMDREEKRILKSEMPSRNGAWQFSFDQDKITDEERVQAFTRIEGSQAKYVLTVTCKNPAGELVISTFELAGTDPKRIPWSGLKSDKDIRVRIDSNPAFDANLEMRGYVNQGQFVPIDSAQFRNLLHSSRLVFADVFPDEQVEVATAYPAQFGRLCELVAPSLQFR